MTAETDLIAAFESLKQPRVLVLGDLILDRYTTGDAERVSQESPVIVLRAQQRESRLGGAANVANMLRGLRAEVLVAGVVGVDESGCETTTLLREAGCDCSMVVSDSSRPTTVKERFVGRAAGRHPNQILRVDHEVTDALNAKVQTRLLRDMQRRMELIDAVVVSDYAKGVCTPTVVRETIRAARAAGVPVIIDPQRGGSYEHYRGATLLKPNRLETELATGRKVQSPDDAYAAGQALCRQLELDMAVVTLDRDGMCLVERNGPGGLFPINARPVYDITGAGDMVTAMLAVCLGGRVAPGAAVPLANVAAGLEVEQIGAAVIPRDEILAELHAVKRPGGRKIMTVDAAARAAAAHRLRGQRVVFTNGCFDLLHVGHATYLAQAKAMGDVLVVGVNADAGVRRLKGPTRPVISEADRAAMLAAMAAVDYVVVFDEDTPHRLLHAIQPDVLVKGGTYQPHEVVGHEVVTGYGGEIRVAGVVDGISTTNILESLQTEPLKKAS